MTNKLMLNIYKTDYINIKEFKDKVFISITVMKDYRFKCNDGNGSDYYISDLILFIDENRDVFLMLYLDAWNNEVYIEDICGDIQGLVGSPILLAEENETSKRKIYKVSTEKESVTIRWYSGYSRYYSETASLVKLDKSINRKYIDKLLESIK